jgi:hypothetical protein
MKRSDTGVLLESIKIDPAAVDADNGLLSYGNAGTIVEVLPV